MKLTKSEIDDLFIGTNYGGRSKEDVIKYGLLKAACGYGNGWTTTNILRHMGLISIKNNLTKKGKKYLYELFKRGFE